MRPANFQLAPILTVAIALMIPVIPFLIFGAWMESTIIAWLENSFVSDRPLTVSAITTGSAGFGHFATDSFERGLHMGGPCVGRCPRPAGQLDWLESVLLDRLLAGSSLRQTDRCSPFQ